MKVGRIEKTIMLMKTGKIEIDKKFIQIEHKAQTEPKIKIEGNEIPVNGLTGYKYEAYIGEAGKLTLYFIDKQCN